MMQKPDLKKILLSLGFFTLLFLGFNLFNSGKAEALLISNVAPLTNSACVTGTNCGKTTTPWFAVGEGQFNGAQSYAKVYVPHGYSATLAVRSGGGVCNAPTLDVGSPQVNYRAWIMDANEGLSSATLVGPVKSNLNYSNCADIPITLSGGTRSGVTGHTNFDVYYFEAMIVGPGVGDNEKNFRLSVGSSGGASFVGVSAPDGPYGSTPWFGIYQRDEPTSVGISPSSCSESSPNNANPIGCNWNWSINYGPRCDEKPAPANKAVNLYDVDWQVYAQPRLLAQVEQDSRNNGGTPNWVNAAPATAQPAGYSPMPLTTYRSWNGSGATAFVAGSHTNNDLAYTSTDTNRYGIFFQDIDFHNTIQISLPNDQFDGSDQVKCPTLIVACSTTATPSTSVKTGDNVYITVTLKNISVSGGPNIPAGYELRQVYNPADSLSAPNGGVRDLSTALQPGQSVGLSPPFTVTRATSQTVDFYYALFDGTTAGANAVGNNPLCHIKITWGTTAGGPNGSIATTCGTTTISGVNLNDQYNPPAGASPTIPPRSIQPIKAKLVPVRVHVTGNGVDFYYYPTNGAPNDGSPVSFSTYNMGDNSGVTMWAHMSYHVELEVQGDSINQSLSVSYNDDGKWADSTGATYFNPVSVAASDDTPSDCLDASCGGQTPADVEPGQSTQFHYTIVVTNNTQKSYNDNNGGGYNFTASTSGGFANVGGVSASPDPFGSGSVPVDVSFPARLDYTGDYTIYFNYQGSPLALNSITPCPGEEIPKTRPFFEVRAGDISTGGGFTTLRNGSNSCGNAGAGDSAYISPNVTGYNYSGDIRAFSRPNQAIGSLAQFGTYSLGLTIGTIGGPIGFYSTDNALFANTSSPTFSSIDNQGYTGYLNSSPTAHCTPVDFFNSTRTTTSSFNGDLTNSPNGQYTSLGTTINGATIGTGKQITLYVDGDLTINGDIKYTDAWDPNNQNSIPYLVIIVRGNITLTNNVRQLDGLYIAQPNGSSGGYFDTCDSGSYCPNGLIVNGAIIAQQVDLLRASGSMGPCDAASPTCSLIGNGPAEVINYVPSMIIGLPNLLQNNSGAIIPSGVEGIFSLPPVF